MNTVKKYWDHSTKPSTWVVKDDEKELFRGSYINGVMYLKSLESDGMISFKDNEKELQVNVVRERVEA